MKGNLVFTATTLRKIALLGILSLSLIACGKAKSGESSSAGSQAATKQESDGTAKQEENGSSDQKAENKDNKKIPLRVIANNNNVAHIDSVIAQYAGLYDKNGLDTTIQFNPSNPDNIQALLADKADLVSAGSSAVLNYIDNGSDIVIIGGQMSLGETVYVRPERF
ncbi:ABC transporter substrate-binding protein [Oribacterium sinus]|uniref:ABC transporter substrate-binding protein n=1 Tax=Oribacterium sinus TaxID=237576 RepID=UPI0028D38EB2|nr:ABC transporter substrate-binding protein [Oribacterium sinus]